LIVLGIESSCDETSASIVKENKIVSNIIYSQEIHNQFGGVVPEIASREHQKHITVVVDKAIKEASIHISMIDAIAVTYGAGLKGALLVGINFAKGMSIALGIPYIGINHLEGHLFSNITDNSNLSFPFISLVVSGGHTQIWKVNSIGDYVLLANTVDDAAGEAFDKGARLLGLGYPGGPEIQKVSKDGSPDFIDFPRPTVKKNKFNFSFSGLKTALLYRIKDMDESYKIKNLHHIASSYQEAIVDTLLDRIEKISNEEKINDISIAGGVAANTRFRYKAEQLSLKMNLNIYFPPMQLCTDNAGMIAMAGYEKISNNLFSNLDLEANPNLSL
jgi:N6-L-threonylcarbamoyladenine synthase|tara:strand:+ start:1786 stop:2781 length:996 start_codon:yes stop_codon:yes gene_type:complete